jgi:hypothetical protein
MVFLSDGRVGVDDALCSVRLFDSPYSAVLPKDCAIL